VCSTVGQIERQRHSRTAGCKVYRALESVASWSLIRTSGRTVAYRVVHSTRVGVEWGMRDVVLARLEPLQKPESESLGATYSGDSFVVLTTTSL
jgi:hypothetical protein